MNETDLVELIHRILFPGDKVSSGELDQLQEQFIGSIPHPGGSDLLYYPESWGLSPDASVVEIARTALSWNPPILAMTVSYTRPHPTRNDLTCYGVTIEGEIETQVVSALHLHPGDSCSVALSGATMPNGRIAEHGFVDGAFSAGQVIENRKRGHH